MARRRCLRVVECRARFSIRTLAEIMSLAISVWENVYAAITTARADPPANLQTRRQVYMYIYALHIILGRMEFKRIRRSK